MKKHTHPSAPDGMYSQLVDEDLPASHPSGNPHAAAVARGYWPLAWYFSNGGPRVLSVLCLWMLVCTHRGGATAEARNGKDPVVQDDDNDSGPCCQDDDNGSGPCCQDDDNDSGPCCQDDDDDSGPCCQDDDNGSGPCCQDDDNDDSGPCCQDDDNDSGPCCQDDDNDSGGPCSYDDGGGSGVSSGLAVLPGELLQGVSAGGGLEGGPAAVSAGRGPAGRHPQRPAAGEGRGRRQVRGGAANRGGAQLAVILSAHQQGFLWDLLPRGYWNAFWFGLSDQHTEDVWTWVDGTPLVGGFWEEGEPNDHNNEDCGYMVKTLALERVAVRSWYDAPCYMSLPFICQKALGTGPPIAPASH
ncbi:unnamed protein product [Boreogadus saida]